MSPRRNKLFPHSAEKTAGRKACFRKSAAPLRAAVAAALALLIAGSAPAEDSDFETIYPNGGSPEGTTDYEGTEGGTVTADMLSGWYYGSYEDSTGSWVNYTPDDTDIYRERIGLSDGSQTVTISGSSGNSISSGVHAAFSVYGGTITLGGTVYAQGRVEIGSDSTQTLSTSDISNDGGQIVLLGSSISTGGIYAYGSTANLYASGQLSAASDSDELSSYISIGDENTESIETGEVGLYGTSDLTISASGSISLENLIGNSSGTISISAGSVSIGTALTDDDLYSYDPLKGIKLSNGSGLSISAEGDIDITSLTVYSSGTAVGKTISSANGSIAFTDTNIVTTDYSVGSSILINNDELVLSAANGTIDLGANTVISGSGAAVYADASSIEGDDITVMNGASGVFLGTDTGVSTESIALESFSDNGASAGSVMKADSIAIGSSGSTAASVVLNENEEGLSLEGSDITIAGGIWIHGSSVSADASDSLTVSKGANTNGAAVEVSTGVKDITLGSDTSATVIDGTIFLKDPEWSDSDGTTGTTEINIYGKTITLNATEELETSAYPAYYSSIVENAALYLNGYNSSEEDSMDFTAGSSSTESLTVNGRIVLPTGTDVTLIGQSIAVNGVQNDVFSSDSGTTALTIEDGGGGSTVTIGSADYTDSVYYAGSLMPAEGSVYTLHGQSVEVDNSGLAAVLLYDTGKSVVIGDESSESTVIKGSLLVNYASDSTLAVHGKQITVADAMADSRINSDYWDWGTDFYNTTEDDESASSTQGVSDSEADSVTDAVIFSASPSYSSDDSGLSAVIGDSGVSAVDIGGRVLALYGNEASAEAAILGSSICIHDLESRNENVVVAAGMGLEIGDDETDSVDIEGGIMHYGYGSSDSENSLSVRGASVLINPASGKSAVQAQNGALVTVGNSAGGSDDAVVINGESLITNGATLKILGSNIVMNPNGRSYALRLESSSASVGTESTLSASLTGLASVTASDLTVLGESIAFGDGLTLSGGSGAEIGSESTASATLSGETSVSGSTLSVLGKSIALYGLTLTDASSATVGSSSAESTALYGVTSLTGGSELTVSGESVTVESLSATDSSTAVLGTEGTLLVTVADITADESSSISLTAGAGSVIAGSVTDETLSSVTIRLTDGGTWAPESGSTLGTLSTHNAAVTLSNGTTGDAILLGSWDDDPSTLTLEVNADSNTGNDTVYIAGAHSGETYIEVDTGGDVWTSAMIGTVLVLMGEEQGVFSTSQTMTSDLYFYSLYIDERGTTSAENLAAGYSTEVYISSIVQSATDENGRYTAPVQEIASAAGTNYTLWRSLQDTLMHRFGDVHEALGPDGEHTVWARARGARFGARSGPLDWKTSWSAFEGGLDLAAFRSEHSANYLGAGFAYFDGDSTYDVGEGDSSGIVLGLYDTYVRDDGQHVDASFKVTHISTDAKGAGGSGTLSNTGVTLGAEYGWKIPLGGGWFAEPQAQVTVGWMDSDTFVNSIGIRTSVDSATGVWTRAGLRAGWEGRGVQFFAKADWNRDFGGDVDFAMSEGSERLALSHDFGTGWLEYGAGLAVRLGDSAQLWLLADRGHGGSGAPEWSWNAGLRWSF